MRGVADLALRGYYQGRGAGGFEDISGLGFQFRNFIPGVGVLAGSFEGYRRQGGAEFGDTYLELRGFRWVGRRWTATGGDFRSASSPGEFPIYNLSFPEFNARGVRVEAVNQSGQFSFFLGRETVLAGPRVPFRVTAPQTVLGAEAQRRIGARLVVGARLTRFWTSEKPTAQGRWLLPPSRAFRSVNNLTLRSLLTVRKDLRLYGEATPALLEPADGLKRARSGQASWLGAFTWESGRLGARANYARLAPSYLPVLGYFVGDRRGPFAEARFRPFSRLEWFGSASRYTNNLERNPELPTYRSRSANTGVSVTLPWRFGATSQLSTVRLSVQQPGTEGTVRSEHRQVSGSLNRSFRRHGVRLTLRDLTLKSEKFPERQRSAELEEHVLFRRVSLSGAVRAHRAVSDQRRDTLFFRGSAQARLHRLTLHAIVETGNDLVNRTLFATNTIRTTSFGVAAALSNTWSLRADMFRYDLAMRLNPESVFVLGGRGVGLAPILGGLNQWNVFFQLSKQLRWGGGLPLESLDRYTAEQIPLEGAVEGFVHERLLEGSRPAEGIPVSLDRSRTAVTDAEGRFHFPQVPEGVHRLALAEQELPAEFEPGPAREVSVTVTPRRVARADLDVIRLLSSQGRVSFSGAGPFQYFENIVIRLLPTGRYTTPDAEGTFAFYNLREGDYEVSLDTGTLPLAAVLTTPERIPLALRHGAVPAEVHFQFTIPKQEPPVRKIFERQIISRAAR